LYCQSHSILAKEAGEERVIVCIVWGGDGTGATYSVSEVIIQNVLWWFMNPFQTYNMEIYREW